VSVRADLAAHAEAIRRDEVRRSRRLQSDPHGMATADAITAQLVDHLLAPVFAYLDANASSDDAADRVSRAFNLDSAVSTAPVIDRATRLLAVQLIYDIIDALELWQSLGETDARWVQRIWSRRVTPLSGLRLPATADAGAVHAVLLEWQMMLAEGLP
jgi:hypothetical protein